MLLLTNTFSASISSPHSAPPPHTYINTYAQWHVYQTAGILTLFSCHLHPPTWNTMCLNVTLNDGNNELTGYAYVTEKTGKWLVLLCCAASSSTSPPANFNLSAVVPDILMWRPDFAPTKDAQIPLLLLLTGAAFPCSAFITSDMWRHKPSNRVKVRQI